MLVEQILLTVIFVIDLKNSWTIFWLFPSLRLTTWWKILLFYPESLFSARTVKMAWLAFRPMLKCECVWLLWLKKQGKATLWLWFFYSWNLNLASAKLTYKTKSLPWDISVLCANYMVLVSAPLTWILY